MRKVKTMDCGYCPFEFCPVQESGGERSCPYVRYDPDECSVPDEVEGLYPGCVQCDCEYFLPGIGCVDSERRNTDCPARKKGGEPDA